VEADAGRGISGRGIFGGHAVHDLLVFFQTVPTRRTVPQSPATASRVGNLVFKRLLKPFEHKG
jgi:hypothetical protein